MHISFKEAQTIQIKSGSGNSFLSAIPIEAPAAG